MPTFDPAFLLFVPGDRPERFHKALDSGASGAILDLEDAVAPQRKREGRDAVAAFLDRSERRLVAAVRINGPATSWFADDLEMLRGRSFAALVVPKAEDVRVLDAAQKALGAIPLVALVESARGVLAAAEIAAHPSCVALAFGPYDLAADLGGASDWESMLPHRAHVLVAARAASRLAIDGPATTLRDRPRIFEEAQRAAQLGYDGKLLVHPEQIEPVRAAFRPGDEEIARARRIVEAAASAMPATVDGAMVDAPMLALAQRTLERARRFPP